MEGHGDRGSRAGGQPRSLSHIAAAGTEHSHDPVPLGYSLSSHSMQGALGSLLPQAATCAALNNLRMLWVVVMRCHSPFTFS